MSSFFFSEYGGIFQLIIMLIAPGSVLVVSLSIVKYFTAEKKKLYQHHLQEGLKPGALPQEAAGQVSGRNGNAYGAERGDIGTGLGVSSSINPFSRVLGSLNHLFPVEWWSVFWG